MPKQTNKNHFSYTRLRDDKGRFTSKEKQTLIETLAQNNGYDKTEFSEVLQFYNENYNTIFKPIINSDPIPYSLELNKSHLLNNKTIFVNGIRMSKKEALHKMQLYQNHVKTNAVKNDTDVAYILFNCTLQNENNKKDVKQKSKKYNRININIPRQKGNFENFEDYIEDIEGEIDIYINSN